MKDKQGGFIVPLLIAIAAILLIGGGAYAYLYKSPGNSEASTSTEVTGPVTATSTASKPLPEMSPEFCNEITQRTIGEIQDSGASISDADSYGGSCTIDIGNGVSDIFSFDADKTVLNIYSSRMALLQTIPLEYSISPTAVNLHDDINYDGYKDLLVQVFGPRASEFTYYIYDPAKGIFEPSDVLSFIFTPTFDAAEKEISATPDTPDYYTDENGNQRYYTPAEQTTVFKFIDGEYVEAQDGTSSPQ